MTASPNHPKTSIGESGTSSGASYALRRPAAVALFLAVTLAGLAGDLLSKHAVFQSLLNDEALIARANQYRNHHPGQATTRDILGHFQRPVFWRVKFSLSVNSGVVFGWPLPPWAVIIATVVTVALVGFFFATSEAGAWMMHLALACILAGALGNLYDRLFSEVAPLGMTAIHRNVRDFIDCSQLHYPYVFNVADALLVVGIVVMAVHWFRTERRRSQKETATRRA